MNANLKKALHIFLILICVHKLEPHLSHSPMFTLASQCIS
jgi:hypothetical protein